MQNLANRICAFFLFSCSLCSLTHSLSLPPLILSSLPLLDTQQSPSRARREPRERAAHRGCDQRDVRTKCDRRVLGDGTEAGVVREERATERAHVRAVRRVADKRATVGRATTLELTSN